MASLNLFLETITKSLAGGLNMPLGLQLPALRQEESLSLAISVITQISQFTAPLYELKTLTGCSCRVNIGTAGASIAEANPAAFSIDVTGTKFIGTLALNTAGITALTDRQSGVYFEILVTEASGATYGRRFPVFIEKAIYLAGSLSTPAGDTALGKLEAARTFVKYEGDAGAQIILKSADGTKRAVLYVDDDGSVRFEPIS